jgi:GNAT superfamily N-acetyltransferase
MGPTNEPLILQSPKSPDEWDAYFDLRWRILRQPWDQARWSERDSLDDSAFHLFLLGSARKPLTCGRLYFNAPDQAELRFMVLDENARGRGYGSRILGGLGGRGNASRRSKGRAKTPATT